VGQLINQGLLDLTLNSHFFKELSEKPILEQLVGCLFSEDKTTRMANLRIQVLNVVSLLLHPIFGTYLPFPWLPVTAQTEIVNQPSDKASFNSQFVAYCYQLLQRNTAWVASLIDLFEKSPKDSLAQLSVLRVNFSDQIFYQFCKSGKDHCLQLHQSSKFQSILKQFRDHTDPEFTGVVLLINCMILKHVGYASSKYR
jgi:hypothetical protein